MILQFSITVTVIIPVTKPPRIVQGKARRALIQTAFDIRTKRKHVTIARSYQNQPEVTRMLKYRK